MYFIGEKIIKLSNCTNQGPGPLQRGDNYKNAKMGWGHLKIFPSTTKPEKLTKASLNKITVFYV
jgi:hypothetical protein